MGEKALLHEERKRTKLPYYCNEDPFPSTQFSWTFRPQVTRINFALVAFMPKLLLAFKVETDNFKIKHRPNSFKSIAPSNNETQGYSSSCWLDIPCSRVRTSCNNEFSTNPSQAIFPCCPVLKIGFGPPHTDFGSVWSPPKARKFRLKQQTT